MEVGGSSINGTVSMGALVLTTQYLCHWVLRTTNDTATPLLSCDSPVGPDLAGGPDLMGASDLEEASDLDGLLAGQPTADNGTSESPLFQCQGAAPGDSALQCVIEDSPSPCLTLRLIPAPRHDVVWTRISNLPTPLACQDESSSQPRVVVTCDSSVYNSNMTNWTLPGVGAGVVASCAVQIHPAPTPTPTVRKPRGPPPPKYDFTFLFALGFIVMGVFGNVLVCLAIILDRRLHNFTNYFLLSLAFADLLVCVLVMPLGAIPGFLGYWPFGLTWCNVYTTCDVLACSSSILHMCFISMGRYTGVRYPLRNMQGSKKRVGLKVCLAWLLAMLISSSITVLGIINPQNIMPEEYVCVINNRMFFVFGSLVAFYIPMIFMLVSFLLTMKLLKNKEDELDKIDGAGRYAAIKPKHKDNTGSSDALGVGEDSTRCCFCFRSACCASLHARSRRSRQPRTSRSADSVCQGDQEAAEGPESTARTTLWTVLSFLVNPTAAGLGFFQKKPTGVMNRAAVVTEQKATKVLGVVFTTFVMCWTPFFVLNIVFAACPSCRMPSLLVDLCLWLGYASSTINPIIYTVFNRTFRTSFYLVLTGQWEELSRPPRYFSMHEARHLAGAAGCGIAANRAAFPVGNGATASNAVKKPQEDDDHKSNTDEHKGEKDDESDDGQGGVQMECTVQIEHETARPSGGVEGRPGSSGPPGPEGEADGATETTSLQPTLEVREPSTSPVPVSISLQDTPLLATTKEGQGPSMEEGVL